MRGIIWGIIVHDITLKYVWRLETGPELEICQRGGDFTPDILAPFLFIPVLYFIYLIIRQSLKLTTNKYQQDTLKV